MITLRFLANSREVGSIIGKKGDNVKKVREESGSRVNISDSSTPERIVTITGSTPEVIKAFSMICAKFEQDGQNFQLNSAMPLIMFRLVIPNSHCGSLIGKSGSNIKELREMTGATIQISNEMLLNSTERAVMISGSTDSIMQCIQRLCTIATETKTKSPIIPYQPAKSGGYGPGGPGMYNGRTGYPPMASGRNYMPRQAMMKGQSQLRMMDDISSIYSNPTPMSNNYSGMIGGYGGSGRTQTQELFIPNHTIGSIIGKQGSRINGIRQSSQAIIKIADLEEGSTDRKVTITGSPASVSSALYLIHGIQAKYGSSPKRL